MIKNKPKVMYLEEALEFIESIPQSAGDKLLGIIHRAEKIRQEYFNAKKNDNGTGW